MWVWGMGIGLVVFVVGAATSIQAFLDARGFGGVLPGFLLAAVGFALFWGFLLWGVVYRRRNCAD